MRNSDERLALLDMRCQRTPFFSRRHYNRETRCHQELIVVCLSLAVATPRIKCSNPTRAWNTVDFFIRFGMSASSRSMNFFAPLTLGSRYYQHFTTKGVFKILSQDTIRKGHVPAELSRVCHASIRNAETRRDIAPLQAVIHSLSSHLLRLCPLLHGASTLKFLVH